MKTQYNTGQKTDVGRVRQQNEDYFGSLPLPSGEGHLFVVCDGMGGHAGGNTASKTAVDTIINYFFEAKDETPQVGFHNSFLLANQAIREKVETSPELKGMGTTATIVYLKDNEAHIAHIGDSRIYLLSEKKLHRLTKDQSYVQSLVDMGIITPQEAERHVRKNEIMQALGVKPEIQPIIPEKPVLPSKGDIFLLCTDGLCGYVDDETIEKVLQENEIDIQQKAEKLVELANNNGGKDNITVQLIEIIETENPKTILIDKPEKEKTDIYKTVPIKTSELEEEPKKVAEKEQQLKLNVPTPTPNSPAKKNYMLYIGIFAVLLIVTLVVLKIFGSETKYFVIVSYNNQTKDSSEFTDSTRAIEFASMKLKNLISTQKKQEGKYFSGVWKTKNSQPNKSEKPIWSLDKEIPKLEDIQYCSFIYKDKKSESTIIDEAYHKIEDDGKSYINDYFRNNTSNEADFIAELVEKDNKGKFTSNSKIVYTVQKKKADSKNSQTTKPDSIKSQKTDSTETKRSDSIKNNTKKMEKVADADLMTLKRRDTIINGKKFSGFKNAADKWIIQPEFNDARAFSEDFAAVFKNNLWGYINRKGEMVIAPAYKAAIDFSEGYAAVQKDKWGFIDKKGNKIIDFKYDACSKFFEGLAGVAIKDNKSGKLKWGFVNNTGNTVINYEYDEVFRFNGGIAKVKKDNESYNIDRTGKKTE